KFEYSYFILGLAQSANGDHEQAIETLGSGLRLSPAWIELQLVLAYAEAKAGRPERSRARLAKLVTPTDGRYINPVLVAGVYSALGESDKAIEWLERGFDERASFMIWIGIEPQLTNLRGDPRFDALVQKVQNGS